ncbi:hypothetical protein [Streptosporangium sp. KLBMP 9127]|nr:hypothetical protein [Streptosporangium sp. KLBMP 9127]
MPLQPLSVREQSSSIVKGRDGYLVSWAAVLGNRNPWHFGEQVVATVVASSAKGKEVVRMEQPLDAVPPAGTLAFSGQAMAVQRPTQVNITYKPAQWKQAARVTSAFKPFPVSDVITRRQKNGAYLVTGRVGNPYRLAAGSLAVTALLRDDRGRLIGGASTFVDDVRADNQPRFILTVDGMPRGVAKTEVVARTWGTTSRPYEELALGGAISKHTVKPKTAPFAKDRGGQVLAGTGPQ